MQTKLAFLLCLHVIAIGVLLGRYGWQLRLRTVIGVMTYFFAFYAACGLAMNAMPQLYIPEGASAGAGGEGGEAPAKTPE